MRGWEDQEHFVLGAGLRSYMSVSLDERCA